MTCQARLFRNHRNRNGLFCDATHVLRHTLWRLVTCTAHPGAWVPGLRNGLLPCDGLMGHLLSFQLPFPLANLISGPVLGEIQRLLAVIRRTFQGNDPAAIPFRPYQFLPPRPPQPGLLPSHSPTIHHHQLSKFEPESISPQPSAPTVAAPWHGRHVFSLRL